MSDLTVTVVCFHSENILQGLTGGYVQDLVGGGFVVGTSVSMSYVHVCIITIVSEHFFQIKFLHNR